MPLTSDDNGSVETVFDALHGNIDLSDIHIIYI